jgi:hypothetical protein
MAKGKDEDIKVVVMNPEKLPEAEEKLTRFLYEEYIKALREERIEFDKDGNIIKVKE